MAKLQQIMSHKQLQELSLKPKMLQSLQMLALPLLELEVHLKHELETNPILELQDDYENILAKDEEKEENKDSPEEETTDETENDDKKDISELEELSEILDEWNDFHFNEQKQSNKASVDTEPRFDQFLRYQEGFKVKYLTQLDSLNLTENEYLFAEELIDSIDNHGYLSNGEDYDETVDAYGLTMERAEDIRKSIMQLQPKGVCAKTIEECLVAQLDPNINNYQLIRVILEEYFNDLIHRRYQLIANRLSVTVEMVLSCRQIISQLDPKPGLIFLNTQNTYVVPDVVIRKIGEELEVLINDYWIPNIVINKQYRNLIKRTPRNDRQTIEYVRNKINSAKFLVKSIYMRNRTLLRVTHAIIEHQRNFFYNNTGILEPLTYSVIAAELHVNESTISRVVKDKYADTPYGIFALKEFFTTTAGKDRNYEDVSRQLVQMHIQKIVDQEDKQNPVCDQKIVEILKEHNINVSRRVIAKYRENIGILNSRLRRKE